MDVFLANHASFFDLHDKRPVLVAGAARDPFVDPEGHRRHLARWRDDLERKAREQAAGGG